LKGDQNLTLETISKLEKALGITLIDIQKSEEEREINQPVLNRIVKSHRVFVAMHNELFEIFVSTQKKITPIQKSVSLEIGKPMEYSPEELFQCN
jgi:hypothetical protein